ncbi:Sugar or nucleoside kinase, ribokinase family [Deinococcus saxicola]|uniref:carbohydrate kinase family protein n=1 Tax=Deinococcus saxicola TaxID=249406 RepID=UPI0039EF8CE2
MRPLLVCGTANVETVFRLGGEELPTAGGVFPDALSLNVSGVGVNLALGLRRLGSPVNLLTLAADDPAGELVRARLGGIETRFVPTRVTPQTLALVRPDGTHTFYRNPGATADAPAPITEFLEMLPGCPAALLTNVGWTRELLPLARRAGVPILTDVQSIAGLDNPYDAPYFAAADVLLLSAEHLSDPAALMRGLLNRSPARLVMAGLGEAGALLLERAVDGFHHQPAFPVQAVHRGGAGDALAAAFAHFSFTRGRSAREALRLACAAAALKLRGGGSGTGHASEEEVLELANRR